MHLICSLDDLKMHSLAAQRLYPPPTEDMTSCYYSFLLCSIVNEDEAGDLLRRHKLVEITSCCIFHCNSKILWCQEALPESDNVRVNQTGVIDNFTLHLHDRVGMSLVPDHLILQAADLLAWTCISTSQTRLFPSIWVLTVTEIAWESCKMHHKSKAHIFCYFVNISLNQLDSYLQGTVHE